MGESSGVGQVVAGHAALLGCFVLYLAWWVIFFRPAAERPAGALRAVGVACIAGAALLGVIGVALACAGVAALPASGQGVPTWHVAVGGLVAYAALFAITTIGFDRPPTTELIIIVGWGTLELATLNALYRAGVTAPGVTLALMVVMVAALLLSMACYVRYYDLTGMAALVDGAVPLACGIVLAAALIVVLA